ncbi:MAG: hypothetical protein NC402_02530 [Prevotella sp.]|nr:hypothetical protein [Prevotella sp.]MCM1074678.1 hypothetical protein [Ruminococcus sp.]
MNKIRLIILTVVAALTQIVCPAAADAQTAEKAYNAGSFNETIRLLEQDIAQGTFSSEIYYDLGNAYFKTGNNGAAMLNYSKALLINPSNKDAQNNLKYVQAQVQLINDSLTEGKNMDSTPAEEGLSDSVQLRIASFGSNLWAVIALISFILLLFCVAIYVFVKNVKSRKVGFFGGIALIILTVLFVYCSVISKRAVLANNTCVLMASEATLQSEVEPQSPKVGTPLSAGTVFKIMGNTKDTSGNLWVKVYLNPEYSGWLPATDIAVIELPELAE